MKNIPSYYIIIIRYGDRLGVIAFSKKNNRIETVLNEIHISNDVITAGNIKSEDENALRAKIMKHFRGWRDSRLFENFPDKINWIWCVFGEEDIFKIIYINYSYWNELSNYTGSPLEAAKTILSGKTIYDVPNDNSIKFLNYFKMYLCCLVIAAMTS